MFSEIIVRIIEDISNPFVLLDADGRIIFFNDQLLAETGFTSREILDDGVLLRYVDLAVLESGDATIDLQVRGGESRRYDLKLRKVPSFDGLYSIIGFWKHLDGRGNGTNGYRDAYLRMFRFIRDPMLSVDPSGEVIEANPAFEAFIEYRRNGSEKPWSGNFASLMEGDGAYEEFTEKVLSSEGTASSEIRMRTLNGDLRRAMCTCWTRKDRDGAMVGYSIHLEDITHLRIVESRLLISERNYGVLFDTFLASIIILDIDGKIVNMNTAARELYGYSWEEVTGELFDTVFRVDQDQPPITKILRRVDRKDGRFLEPQVKRRCRDGSVKHTFAIYVAIKDSAEETVGYSVTEQDLTGRVDLENKLKESLEETKETQAATIMGFARLTEYRDTDTGRHLDRIKAFTRILATRLRELPEYSEYITDTYIEDLCTSSTLHDIGKIGIEDSVLLKNGKLDDTEFKRMKQHSVMGGDALSHVDSQLKRRSFLTMGKEVAYYHHEKWDGSGYPEGLAGKDIPLSARIVAIADVYDALTNKRPYKEAFSHEEAVTIIRKDRGRHFDPDIADVFMANHEVFLNTARYIEIESDPQSIADIMGSPGGELA